tara:strand:+ start:1068 stop:2054 length:987 start_codon:yes stop_codon:yes gene_type:complete
MPTQEEKKNEKMVDIDTTGPGAEIEVTEEKKPDQEVEVQNEEVKQDDTKSADTSEKSDEQPVVQDSKPEQKEDEKLEEYSETVNKRIAKLTKKWREAERQKDAAIDYAKGVEHKRKQWETRYAKLDSTYLRDSETRVKSQLDGVKGKLAAAIEAGDTAKQVEAQAELSALTSDVRSIESQKLKREEYEKEPRTPAYGGGTPEQTPTLPQVDEKAENWATKNNWFGSDRAMTFTAFEIHKDLVEKEGFDPKSDEYYAEIDKRIKVDFPHKFGKTAKDTSKTVQTVASVKRSVKPGRKNVKLTSSQVQIARKLGVPLEEYAKQLLNTEGA